MRFFLFAHQTNYHISQTEHVTLGVQTYEGTSESLFAVRSNQPFLFPQFMYI